MQQALMEAKSVEQPHRLTLDSRSRLSVTGVLEVESFDETEILLTSTRGPLSIVYEDDAPRGGFFARLFG